MTPTENIQNPSWMAEHHSLCNPGWQLRLTFLGYPTDGNRDAWINHVRTCPECQEYFAEIHAAALVIAEQDTELIDEEPE